MKIAVIGSGISGLTSAYLANRQGHEVHLFEANDYFGGHSHTIDVKDEANSNKTAENHSFPLDTGFLVHNKLTYPNLIELFKHLKVETIESEMSLSIQAPNENIEWAGHNLNTVFGQRKNLLNPRFYAMLLDILRLNRNANQLLKYYEDHPEKSLGDLLNKEKYSHSFIQWYIIPMAAAIWSTPSGKILTFPAATFLRFCINHRLLQVNDRPQWRTVKGGSREYVKKMTDSLKFKYLRQPVLAVERTEKNVVIRTAPNSQTTTSPFESGNIFDKVIFAIHGDQILKILSNPSDLETSVLTKFKYQKNTALVHKDISFLPRKQNLWAAWNYISSPDTDQVSVSYLINKLQPLPTQHPYLVTLNPHKKVPQQHLVRKIIYEHPVFDAASIQAQKQIESIQGNKGSYFAGAWCGYGFHEDGLKASLRVLKLLGIYPPWQGVYE